MNDSNRGQATISYVQDTDSWMKRQLVNLIEVASGRNRLTRIYSALRAEPFAIPGFFTRALALGGVKLRYNQSAEADIPASGPVIFIANHPFGIVDGVIMCELAARTRGDFRILLNARLCKDENLEQYFLPIDFDGTRAATKTNVTTKREAERILLEGGTLIIFPAGGVATKTRFGFGPLDDLPWTTFAAKLVRKTEATVVPVFFHGENSFLFHFLSGFSDTLRMSVYIYEVTRQLGTTLRFNIGKPIPYREIQHLENRKDMTDTLRAQTFSLAQEANSKGQMVAARAG